MSRNYYQQRQMTPRDRHCMPNEMTPFPYDAAVAMAYVPFQTDTAMYDDMKALCEGTLFVCLNKPFLGAGVCK
jgi:hypothetical protein